MISIDSIDVTILIVLPAIHCYIYRRICINIVHFYAKLAVHACAMSKKPLIQNRVLSEDELPLFWSQKAKKMIFKNIVGLSFSDYDEISGNS